MITLLLLLPLLLTQTLAADMLSQSEYTALRKFIMAICENPIALKRCQRPLLQAMQASAIWNQKKLFAT